MLKARMLMVLRFCFSIMGQTTWLAKFSDMSFIPPLFEKLEQQKRKLAWRHISLSKTAKQNLRYGCLLMVIGNIIAIFALS